jgi:hypothetical protein
MKFNYRKIASVLASAVMLTSTVGFAAAANYPSPFSGGGAVVYGINAANTDMAAAIDVYANLKGNTKDGGTLVSTTGETAALFTSSSKININDTLQQVKTVLSKTELPVVLKDGSFSGNVDATFTQLIDLGFNARIAFEKMPTSSSDPLLGLKTSTNTANYIYNTSVTFNKAVNFTHADSKGQEIIMFGQKFTVASATSYTDLVLLKSAEKVSLSSDKPTAEVTVGGKKYTLELVSSSDTAATIAVTNEAGTTESKEIAEAASKKVNGLTVAVETADETNLKLSASVIAGAEKVTLVSGSAVTYGDAATSIDGTRVTLTGGPTALTKLMISVASKDSDHDAIMPGDTYIDPVFGTFKVDFTGGFNIPDDFANSKRESIEFRNVGDDKLNVKFKNVRGDESTIVWAKNSSSGTYLVYGDEYRNISVLEKELVYKNDYVMVGNQDEGYLLKVSTITNNSDGFANDKVILTDVMNTANTYTATITADGTGSITIGGKVYTIWYNGTDADMDRYSIVIDSPDSLAAGSRIVFPTIQTSLGAKLGFYEPLNLGLDDVDDAPGNQVNASQLRIPNGNGYTDVTVTPDIVGPASGGTWNFTVGTTVAKINTSDTSAVGSNQTNITVGKFIYNVACNGIADHVNLQLVRPDLGGLLLDTPAVFIIEEKDDNSEYQGMVVTIENGASSTDGIGINDVMRTWNNDATWEATALTSVSTKAKEADLFGSIILTDSGDSDQTTATISYPDEQIYANMYIGAEASAITPGTTGSGGATGTINIVKDTEVSSVSDKNLIVIGGSCINAAAAKILGSDVPLCAADFTEKTQVGAGQYIIKTIASPYNADKVAMLVAGFNADDTETAVKKVLTGVVSDKDSSKIYPEVSA